MQKTWPWQSGQGDENKTYGGRTREETHAPVFWEFWILLYSWEVDACFIYTSIPEVSISYFDALTYLEAWMLENHHKPCYFY